MTDLTALKYTDEHEWVALSDDVATVGITDYAADKLGDIVFVDLPSVGSAVTAGDVCGEIESTKSVGELYAPYVERMPAVRRNFEQTMIKLREAGMWTNDALTMIMNPQMFQVAKPEQPESEDAPPQEDQ